MCHRGSKSLSIREVQCSRWEIADPPTRLMKKKNAVYKGRGYLGGISSRGEFTLSFVLLFVSNLIRQYIPESV